MCVRVSHIVRVKFKWPVLVPEVERKDFSFFSKEFQTHICGTLSYGFKIGERIWSFGQQMHLFACGRACVCRWPFVSRIFTNIIYIWLIQHFYINLVTQEISVKMCALTITRAISCYLPSIHLRLRGRCWKLLLCVFGERKHLKLCHHPPIPSQLSSLHLVKRCPFRATSSLKCHSYFCSLPFPKVLNHFCILCTCVLFSSSSSFSFSFSSFCSFYFVWAFDFYCKTFPFCYKLRRTHR